jgi:hypothetical protein
MAPDALDNISSGKDEVGEGKGKSNKQKAAIAIAKKEKGYKESLADRLSEAVAICDECGNPSYKTLGLSEDELAEVAGPEKCWKGYKRAGTQKGTGKNAGKRVNKCVKA